MRKPRFVRHVIFMSVLILFAIPTLPVASGQEKQTVAPGSELVPSEDPAYADAVYLKKYKLLWGCPTDYFSGRRLLVRYEFAVCVERILRQMKIDMNQLPPAFPPDPKGEERGIADPVGYSPEELKVIRRLYTEFRPEMDRLGNDLPAIDRFLSKLQDQVMQIEKPSEKRKRK